MIKLVNKVPEPYVKYSRDFQLLCRLYDAVFDNVGFNADTLSSIINTRQCRDNMLPLLQTKLGFFSNLQINSEELRYVLEAFPYIVKNKGTMKAVREAVNTWLKALHINGKVIAYQTYEPTLINNHLVPDHYIVLGIGAEIQDTRLLEEIFKYILPTGFGYYIYFFREMEFDSIKSKISSSANIAFISNNINSSVGNYLIPSQVGQADGYSTQGYYKLSNLIGTTAIYSSDSMQVGNNLFLGVLNGPPSGTLEDGMSYIRYNETRSTTNPLYYYDGRIRGWIKCSYVGTFSNISQAPSNIGNIARINFEEYTYMYNDGLNWVTLTFKGEQDVLPETGSYQNYDLYFETSTNKFKFYLASVSSGQSHWTELNYVGDSLVTLNLNNFNKFDLVCVKDNIFYIYLQNRHWVLFPAAYYLYQEKKLT